MPSVDERRQGDGVPIAVPALLLELLQPLIELLLHVDERYVVAEIVEPGLNLLGQLEMRFEDETVLSVLNEFVKAADEFLPLFSD